MKLNGVNVSIWKLWNPDQPTAPTEAVDRKRLTQREKTYKDTKITNTLNVTKKRRSMSKAPRNTKRIYREQESVQVSAPKYFVPNMIYALFGDAFNN